MSSAIHEARPYWFRLQPDPEQTLRDPGTIEFTIDLTRSQFRGISNMVHAMFTSWVQLESPVNKSVLHLGRYLVPNSTVWFPLTSYQEDVIAIIPITHMSGLHQESIRSVIPWTHLIQNPEVIMFPPGRPRPTITKPYTAILVNYYGGVFGVIVQFDNLEFLQGAITLCEWFRLRWRDYIMDIHEGDQLMEVTNIE